MPPELRKRKAPSAPLPAPAPKKKVSVARAAAKVKEAPAPKANGSAAAAAKPAKVAAGDVISLVGFGGEIETQDGAKTTLQKLVEGSEKGVVLFTYPRASTPGCTRQACLFRDSYAPLTATGYAIFGLSTDSPKANTTFKTKQKLPYDLLCDPKASLIAAIGLKKSPSGTVRGIFVVDKEGKVLAAEPGSPAGTVERVTELLEVGEEEVEVNEDESKEEVEKVDEDAEAPEAVKA